jgi:hypothetical protein
MKLKIAFLELQMLFVTVASAVLAPSSFSPSWFIVISVTAFVVANILLFNAIRHAGPKPNFQRGPLTYFAPALFVSYLIIYCVSSLISG